jgi:hypothetical protein
MQFTVSTKNSTFTNSRKNMENPQEIDSVYWDEESKSWKTKMVKVEEYHGFTECRYCQRPMSHNIKTEGEFKVVYVKCGCSKS